MIGQQFSTKTPEVERSHAVMNTPAIYISIENLEKELHLAREMMMTLEQRLSTIMRPEPVRDGRVNPTAPIGSSQMFNHIESLSVLAKAIGDDARSMLDRLEM
jgi:hypothetical protein